MVDITKAHVEQDDVVSEKHAAPGITDAQRHNAVGYDEYLEAMDLEVSNKEVNCLQVKTSARVY